MSDEDFAIRIQLIERKKDKILDSFDAEIPERVRGVESDKSEAPFLVSKESNNCKYSGCS